MRSAVWDQFGGFLAHSHFYSLRSCAQHPVSRSIHLHYRCRAPWWLLLYGRPQGDADFIVQVQHIALPLYRNYRWAINRTPLFSNKSVISDGKRDSLNRKSYRKNNTAEPNISLYSFCVTEHLYKTSGQPETFPVFQTCCFFLSPILADGLIYFQIKNGPWSGNCWTES